MLSTVAQFGNLPTISMRSLLLLDSIAAIEPSAAGAVIISGSHGGRSSSSYAVAITPLPFAVFFNDAGVGKDQAGIFCLEHLGQCEVLAICYSHASACIGQADDALACGVVSHINAQAAAKGVAVGMSVSQAAAMLRFSPR
jgi:hypothetical protein